MGGKYEIVIYDILHYFGIESPNLGTFFLRIRYGYIYFGISKFRY